MSLNKYNNVMIDLETLGLRSTSVILSIGAVYFDIETGETGEEFYCTIDIDSCVECGLTIDAKTLQWWLSKSDSAKDSLNGKMSLNGALWGLHTFLLKGSIKNNLIWANSPKFDLGILVNAYKATDIIQSWDDKNERDVRTLASLAPEIKNECVFNGTEHNPIDDCKHQIKYCSQIWNKLKQ